MQKRTAVGFLVDKIPAYKNTKTIERTQKKKSEKRNVYRKKTEKIKKPKSATLIAHCD